jgi:hypothetical protein
MVIKLVEEEDAPVALEFMYVVYFECGGLFLCPMLFRCQGYVFATSWRVARNAAMLEASRSLNTSMEEVRRWGSVMLKEL